MKKVQNEKEVKNLIMNVRGIAKFPIFEDNKFSVKLLLTEKELERVEKALEIFDDELSITDLSHDNVDYQAIGAKTIYEIPIFDPEGVQINAENEDYQIYDGAECILKINFKPYQYKKKTGVTGYLMGAVIIKQGIKYNNETTFDDFKDFLNEEELEF